MLKADPLIRTKLRRPFTRPGLVLRPRLREQMACGLRGPLTLITAPAGFGKTTLVASCLADCDTPVAWLSLDRDDNRSGRFLHYLVAAIQAADPALGEAAAELIAAPEPLPSEAILTSLINDLDTVPHDVILVLDDYQFITSQSVYEQVAFLLEHCPNTFHLLIASRSDPPLPLARLRARNQLVEFRAADLRFTAPEAAEFLNGVMGLHLDAGSIALLEERSEGWIAGLQMAALSMCHREDVPAFVEGFSGTNRYILDYLLEEVLAGQSQEVQRFLLCTSILERLTAPLCDAILASDVGSRPEDNGLWADLKAPSLRQSASVLEYLERANLFLVPLDDERRWYRYHHLFADLLQARLKQFSGEQEVRNLHLRASRWYEENHHTDEAILHALAAHDYNRAARLIEDASQSTWTNGEYDKLREWIVALPEEVVRARPWLCLWCAWSLTQTGPLQDAEKWIDAAQQAIRTPIAASRVEERQAVQDEINIIRVVKSSLEPDYDKTLVFAQTALGHLPASRFSASPIARCNLLHGLSTAYYLAGELSRAEQLCQEIADVSKGAGFFLRYSHALNKQSHIYLVNGRLRQIYQLLQDALAYLRAQGKQEYFPLSDPYCRLSDLFYQWNDLEGSGHMVAESLRIAEVTELPYLLAGSLNAQGRLLTTRGDWDGARNSLEKAANLIRESICWPQLVWENERYLVKLWLAKGDLARATRWAQEHPPKDLAASGFAQEAYEIVRARVLIAQELYNEAADRLSRLERLAEQAGRNGRLLEIRVLEALAQSAAGDSQKALIALTPALLFAETEGYVRIFLDEGQPMKMLLGQWAAQASAGPTRDYAHRLHALFDAELHPVPVLRGKAATVGSMAESLSEREMEVLRLIALGRTNQEIAHQLIVARGTVKAHTASIYRKLDVDNRTAAVARARQLGLLC
jgi:LuxR family maltose regulon positive regulatory protein